MKKLIILEIFFSTQLSAQIGTKNMPKCECTSTPFTIPDNTNIYSNTTWDNTTGNPITVQGVVTIKTGNTLNINSRNVVFAPKGRIIVEPGAALNINNSSLTGLETCGMWMGIEVWGDPSRSSTDASQGIANISRSRISNAHIAVLLGKRKMPSCRSFIGNNPFDNSYSGGVLVADGDTLENNGIGIKFIKKSNNDGSANKIRNVFITCVNHLRDPRYSTQTANVYPNIYNPWNGHANSNWRTYTGVEIDNLKGLLIYNTKFNNMEFGVLSFDAQQITVKNCTFQHLRQGITIQNSTPTLQSGFDITNCTFYYIPGNTSGTLAANDGTAIYINSGRGYKIHDRNLFNNSFPSNNNYFTYGIKTSNASGIEITNNEFIDLTTGINISNSGSYGSSIKAAPNSSNTNLNYQGNIFDNCNTGIVTQNNNPYLCVRCNDHYTANSNLNWNTEAGGTLSDQGFTGYQNITNSIIRSKYGAGNKFLTSSHYIKNDSSNAYYNYYYQTTPECIPTVIGPINPVSVGVPMYNKTQSCPFPSIIPPQTTITASTSLTDPVFTSIDSLNSAVATLQQQYQNILTNADKGQTQTLLDAIMAKPPSGELKNMLMVNSPLSDTVLIALNTQFPLSNGNYKNVMDENLPVSRKTAPSFYSRIQTLPNGIKNQLISKQSNNPGKTTIGSVELQLDQTRQIKALYFSSVISALLDSAVNRKADAITLLEREATPEANLILASTYMSDSNYTEAAAKIAQLPDDNGAYTDWKAYATMLLTHFEQGKTLEELDSNQIAYIRTLAYQCSDEMATANAKAVLFYLYRETVPPCPEIQSRQQSLQSKIEKISSSLGDNYPDPFNNQTVIPYCLPDQVKGELIVKDASGKIMLITPLNNAEDKIEINTKNWATGIYFYGLRIDGREEENRKMIKTE